MQRMLKAACLAALVAALAGPASAASCGNGPGGFAPWLESFKQEAVRAGISPNVVASALNGVSYSSKVISLDRNQHSFKLSFDQFYKRRVSNAMISQGRSLIQRHSRLLSAIEQRTGVPPEIIVSIWGLETGYGRNSGSMATFRSLATLAYDCRRSAFFTGELLAALKIVQRGDLSPGEMRGAWAGELGQTQFLASSYLRFAVDGDGNGRRDLIRSVPDVLASTANYLKAYGWQAGASWEPGTANYNVLRQWNKAEVYVQTISVMASKMAGR
ncbi:lytic transglycosylase domain-containing protein [Afifella sp. IM 167]|uniref:lytic murein transglycosylase n=1 Tax=Afifella sp. IM 167 TaxID=2033586 RepID=UPI001CCB15C4|nr:lytic murein transglycosylase [Afifella sp. IM 167]MBZ8133037.1 lytic transglycosylase [Afifella sp. IM 167]